MMFETTPDQDYLLSILKETKSMSKSQALRLLSKLDSRNDERYIVRCLNQLRHMRKIVWLTDELITLKALWNVNADTEMLSAVDIMLDLTDIRVHTLSAAMRPYKLCFISELQNGIGHYAVITVSPGAEASISALLKTCGDDGRMVIFLLSGLSQAELIQTSLPHFFAISDGGKYQYFSGGG